MSRIAGLSTLVLLAALVSGGCQARSVSREVDDYRPVASLKGLRQDLSQSPERVYKRPGAPELAAYDRYIVGPITIDYRDPDMQELSDETMRRLQTTFAEAIARELREGGYTVATKSSPGTMRLEFVVSGFKASQTGSALNAATKAAGMVTGVPMLVKVDTGEVTIEGIFSDAYAKRIDAVAIDRSSGARLLNGASISTWADVDAAFEKWAKGIRRAIDAAHDRAAAARSAG